MKYQFRPYARMQPTTVTLTGKVYEKGEHPLYKDFRIIEVVDEEGKIHYAFEDELTSDEVKEQERSYSEEEVEDLIYKVCGTVARLQGITINGNHLDTAYKQHKKK